MLSKKADHNLQLLRLMAVFTALIMFLSLIESYISGKFIESTKWQIIGLLWIVISLFSIGLLVITFSSRFPDLKRFVSNFVNRCHYLGWINLIIPIFACLLYPILLFGNLGKHFTGFFLRVAILWLLSGIGAFFLKARGPSRKFVACFFLMLLISCAFYQAASYLRYISTNPFSLAWSEGSRFYYASLPFAQTLYGKNLPLSFLHPSRYLIMALPFLVQGLPLWVHRAWQVFLWLSLTFLTTFFLVKRLRLSDSIKKIALVAWIFIFLFQAPVYYHLMVCVILVLWGFDRNNYSKSLILVGIASIWTGISRINWFPLPGILATLLYVLEEPYSDHGHWWDFFKKPISFFIIGLLASFISQAAYIYLSGNQDVKSFTTSFTSDLLWYRLFPSPTFLIGILTGILSLCAPLLIFLAKNLWNSRSIVHNWRKLTMVVILVVFFIGGLVVSVKIGGGSNLHNLDAFVVLLVCVGVYIFSNQIGKESKKHPISLWMPNLLLIGLVLMPVGWALANWEVFPKYDMAGAQQDLKILNLTVQKNMPKKQEILFITERQLLTYQYIKEVPLIPDYELLTLMEMSISHNRDYFQRFENDLKKQRFGLIIAPKQYLIFKDSSTAFPEENNAWVRYVTVPLMQYYQPITWLRSADIEIFARRQLSSP